MIRLQKNYKCLIKQNIETTQSQKIIPSTKRKSRMKAIIKYRNRSEWISLGKHLIPPLHILVTIKKQISVKATSKISCSVQRTEATHTYNFSVKMPYTGKCTQSQWKDPYIPV